MPNRLTASSSPYLLQHKDNPVDWWEWSDEAFNEAIRRDAPVFLSIGYSSCHWCHVMAHESFENLDLAKQLNDNFVAVKVDRQERPDVDAAYMTAVQAMTGHGGWPMSAFLDHDRRPFFAGTYYPPTPRHGSPGFGEVMAAVSDAWRSRRTDVLETGDRIQAALVDRTRRSHGDAIDEQAIASAVVSLRRDFDTQRGGFGAAPKFPPTSVLEFLLRRAALSGDAAALAMAVATCEAMARGGIYDQLGGGFARYSVDADWVVPHFEKMLYDNALLLRNYVHMYALTGSSLASRVVKETAEFLLRDLRVGGGAFGASFDADSEGQEGRYYVWSTADLHEVLGGDAEWIAALCGVSAVGTFEHDRSVLQLRQDPDDISRWRRCREKLLQARDSRVRPDRDDSVVTAWNGLAISGLARAGALLDEASYVSAAAVAMDYVLATSRSVEGLLRVSLADKPGRAPGMLEDYAALAVALLDLYAVTGKERWYHDAERLLSEMLERFSDNDGRLHDSPRGESGLYLDLTDPSDNATPSGSALAADALTTFSTLSGRWLPEAASTTSDLAGPAQIHPRFAGWALAVSATAGGGAGGVAVTGPGAVGSELHRIALRSLVAGYAVAVGHPTSAAVPLVAQRGADEVMAAHVCRHTGCALPVRTPEDLAALLPPLPAE